MSELVTALREQLVDAARREQARRLPRVSPTPRLVLGLAATAAVALALVLVAGGLEPRVQDRQAATPTPSGRELFGGTLEPGVRYRTSEFTPQLSFVVDDDRWMALDTTLEDELRLIRVTRGAPEVRYRIQQLIFLRVNQVADPSVPELAKSLMAVPADLTAWLREHPDLRAEAPRRVTVADMEGERFRARVEFDRPAHVDPWCERTQLFLCTYLLPGLQWPDGGHLEIIVLPTRPEPLVIVMAGISERDVAAVEEAATPLLDSLTITRP